MTDNYRISKFFLNSGFFGTTFKGTVQSSAFYQSDDMMFQHHEEYLL